VTAAAQPDPGCSISIAMTTFNGADFLQEQLDSLASQTRAPLELHIGDDGSTDATESIVERFKASAAFPVHFTRNAARLGFGENFIRTALRCSGQWIAFCDQDDVWGPNKLEWAAKCIAAGPADLRLIAHNATVVDETLRERGPLYHYPAGNSVTGRLGLPPEWYSTGFTQIFDAALLRSIPSSRRVSFPWHVHRDAHDVWIALLANCTGSILRSSEQLVLYRRHHATATDQASHGPGRTPFERLGTGYADRAAYLREVAATLRACVRTGCADFGAMLDDAAERLDKHAVLLDRRARAYREPKLADRLAMIARLVRSGAYTGKSPWRFGTARLIKDSLCSLRIL